MHIFFSGIGGTGLGPLALIAHEAGYKVSGSDKQHSQYIDYLVEHGITDIHIGQTTEEIERVHTTLPIDWFVYSSAVAIEHPDAPELVFCNENGIRMSKRDQLLSYILEEKNLKMIGIAGTHGKTTTTAMAIWLFSRLGIPVSYSLGGKISFGDMGHYEPGSQYFIYEADEYDYNFLAFHPHLSIITGVDWDHPDIYPTRELYQDAYKRFVEQTAYTVMWNDDKYTLKIEPSTDKMILNKDNPQIDKLVHLAGDVNRQDAWQVGKAIEHLLNHPLDTLLAHLNQFPGVSRRFEQLVPHLYTDYAHTPPKIRGTIDTTEEVAKGPVVVVYEGLHNTRQHFIKDDMLHLFDSVKQLYIVPSYLAREDPNLHILTPADIKSFLSPEAQAKTTPAILDTELKESISKHLLKGETVVLISAGGGGSLDEWARQHFSGSA